MTLQSFLWKNVSLKTDDINLKKSLIPPPLFLKIISVPSRVGFGAGGVGGEIMWGTGLASQSIHPYLILSLHFQLSRELKEENNNNNKHFKILELTLQNFTWPLDMDTY